MENTIEVMELSTQDLDTVAGGCYQKEDYCCYEKKRHHHCYPKKYYKKGCGYEGGYEGEGGYDRDDYNRY